ncbi:MAG: FAD-dependent oxidoreductase [Bacteriovoracia bacterium]
MTTLAIIGSGIVGRSLLYTLAKDQKSFDKITLISADNFTFPCTLHSTAIVAPRGVTRGTSPLGDLLCDGYQTFAEHFHQDHPAGVEFIPQISAASEKTDAFKTRYPGATLKKELLKEETLTALEEAFLVDPATYGEWLLQCAQNYYGEKLWRVEDLVVKVERGEKIRLSTLKGNELEFDKVIFAAGTYNRFWKELLPDSLLKTSKSIQGSYLEFNDINVERPSFSLTFNGDNLVWNNSLKRLLVGSTTVETNHVLPDLEELKRIHLRLSESVDFGIPPFHLGVVKTGLREKAKKREPYLIQDGNLIFLGGLYKNGFILSLKVSRSLSHQYL